jgi:hypothetical protein
MMPKRTISFDEWHEAQVVLNPRFDQETQRILKFKGAPTKLDILLDEDLEADLATFLKAMSDFRVRASRPGMDDDSVWRAAKRGGFVLVTADLGFWNDRQFPLEECPGVIILRGATGLDKAHAFMRVWLQVDLRAVWRTFGVNAVRQMKIRATRSGELREKFLDGATIVER